MKLTCWASCAHVRGSLFSLRTWELGADDEPASKKDAALEVTPPQVYLADTAERRQLRTTRRIDKVRE